MNCRDCCIRGPPAPHSPALYTDIPDSVTVTGDSGALATFKDDLGPDTVQVEILDGAVRVSGIHPADLHWVLSLVERGGIRLDAALERLSSCVRFLPAAETALAWVSDRLCAWESELAAAAKATKARCLCCAGRQLTPTTQIHDETSRTVRWWCEQCSLQAPVLDQCSQCAACNSAAAASAAPVAPAVPMHSPAVVWSPGRAQRCCRVYLNCPD
jgi:hypothetical protein